MAESNDLSWETDNSKWHEKDGLETWYRKNKYEE